MDAPTDASNNNETQVTINKPGRIIHFSDGAEEEVELAEESTELQAQPDIDPSTLTWGPWFSHQFWRSGSRILNAVDYAGEGLADFFGITTPKYQIEIDEYNRLQEEKRRLEEESAGWMPRSAGGDVPLVMNEPRLAGDRPAQV